MATTRTQDLLGESLEWAFCYAQIIREVIGERRDKRPLRADHDEACERIKDVSIVPLDAEGVLSLITAHGIAFFQDGDWYALSSGDIFPCMRNLDGERMRAMIAEEDVVSANTLPDAVKKCVVRITLGEYVELPDAA